MCVWVVKNLFGAPCFLIVLGVESSFVFIT
jgi:hypothetical protein